MRTTTTYRDYTFTVRRYSTKYDNWYIESMSTNGSQVRDKHIGGQVGRRAPYIAGNERGAIEYAKELIDLWIDGPKDEEEVQIF